MLRVPIDSPCMAEGEPPRGRAPAGPPQGRPAGPSEGPPEPDREASPGTWEALLLAGMDRALRLSFGDRRRPERGTARPPAAPPEARPPGARPARAHPPGARPAPAQRVAAPRGGAPRSAAPGFQRWVQKAAQRRTWRIEAGTVGLILLAVLLRGAFGPRGPENEGTAPPGLTPLSDSAAAAGGLPPAAPPSPVEGIAVSFERNGTIRLNTGVSVRMFGVSLPGASDRPVVVQTARETLNEVVRGQKLAVEFDPVLTAVAQRGQPTQVGYVWFIDEAGYRRGMLNALVLAYGFGRPVTSIAYRYDEQFAEAGRLAQSRRVGVWMDP